MAPLNLLLLLSLAGADADLSLAPTVPDGFTVELVAGPPLVQHPMMGCFDERGRLFICESAGTNRRSPELLADPLDQILMLEDTDGDGVFDKRTVFADKLVFPQGCLWYRGALYTCSSPYLWKLEDLDDDGVCDQRTVVVKSFGFSGNAADIHGPFLSPDGRIFWCDGRHGHEIRDLGDGEFGGEDTALVVPPDPEPGLPNPEGSLLTRGKAARIFSCKPDGSDVQVWCGGGMDNPVEVDFWETGEVLGTVNLFYGRPRGDCLVHWVEGGVYPRFDQQDSIAEFPSTGGLLGPVHNYGHVAVSGLTRYRSDEFFGPPQRSSERWDNETDTATFFVTYFNTHKVVATTLEREGATFRHLETKDFFVSPDPDCHPTDVIEDADGSLLVIDTGGWFRIGCPTSQIAKPEIAGAIYRIRRNGAHRIDDPRGRQVAWDAARRNAKQMAKLLDDDRPAVRDRAVDEAALAIERDATGSFESDLMHEVFLPESERQDQNLLWALARTEDPNGSLMMYADHASSTNQLIVAHQVAARTGSVNVGFGILGSLDAASQSERRAGIDATWRHHQVDDRPELIAQSIRAVLNQFREPRDPIAEHAAINCLIRLARPQTTAEFLTDPSPRVRRAALIALDQMPGDHLTREQAAALLETTDTTLQASVLDVIARREGWAAETLDVLQDWMDDESLPEARSAVVRGFLSARSTEPEIERLIADAAARDDAPQWTQLAMLDVMASADRPTVPDAWLEALSGTLANQDAELRLQALRTIAARRLDQFDGRLLAIAEDAGELPALRIEAFAAVAGRLEQVDERLFETLTAALISDESTIVDQLRIANALAQARLGEGQLLSLIAEFDDLGTALIGPLLPAFRQSESSQVGVNLIDALTAAESIPAVSYDDLAALIEHFPSDVATHAGSLLDRYAGQDAEHAERLDALVAATATGRADRGKDVFFGKTAGCSGCHSVKGQGSRVGPDLSTIGAIRQKRDLLEAIVFPSASFARGFEPFAVAMEDGRVMSGVIARETATEIVLRTSDLGESRLPRREIEAMRRSPTSIMPSGLESRMSEQDLQDLLAFLESLR